MKTAARRFPPLLIALAATLLAAFLVMLAPLSASAHDALLASSPEADGTVETLPGELTLTFSNKLIDGAGATEVVVTDAAGTTVADGPATVNGAIVTQPLAEQGEAGVYHVVWKVVSSDGHPTSGEFSFTVSTSTVVAPPETSSPAPTAETGTTTETTASSPAPTEAPAEGDAVGPWLLAIVGGLVVVGVVVVLFSRRGNRGSGRAQGSDDASPEPSDDLTAR